eukprot:1171543-Amphidinium_carterae.1
MEAWGQTCLVDPKPWHELRRGQEKQSVGKLHCASGTLPPYHQGALHTPELGSQSTILLDGGEGVEN